MVVVSSAVTRTVIVLDPTSSAIAELAVPSVTGVKLPDVPLRTPTVALPVSATVGVTFRCVCAFATDAV